MRSESRGAVCNWFKDRTDSKDLPEGACRGFWMCYDWGSLVKPWTEEMKGTTDVVTDVA